MEAIRISIVTPSFNQARFIERTIDSVLSQKGDFDLEYIVLDGGSTDGTIAILKGYGDRLRWSSGPDGGQVDAINKGLRISTGDVVGWVNSDDTLQPDALGRVAEAFQSHPGVEWVHGRCEIIDPDDRPIMRAVSAYKHWCAGRHEFEKLLVENYVSQMTTFWRRRVHAEIGYLDPALPLAFDYEFFLRLAKRGPPVYLNERIANFRYYATSKSGANLARQLNEDEAAAMRHMPAGSEWIRRRKHLKNSARKVVYAALASVRGRSDPAGA